MTDRDPFRAVSRDDGQDDDRTLLWEPGPRVQPSAPAPVIGEKQPKRRRGLAFRIARHGLMAFAAYYVFCLVLLIAYRWVNPPTTGVQIQRRVESVFSGGEYRKRRSFVALDDLPRHVPRAVVAAEDGRFWDHSGYDWVEMSRAGREAGSGVRVRGASTLTQQLMKNLFGCACRNPVRKVYDLTLTPAAELILGKRRILELYLNQVEWGDEGVFGIDAGAREHYDRPATRLTRTQAAG
ncbi:MAG TPA: transglycosylase domain-containing protein, partial [Longimicrobium sp.]|uniref:transglycosylase domain-containing protein n=1 Tax=Longimicrobium sp. TaxID=2029185 RepID=UPI002ED93C2F